MAKDKAYVAAAAGTAEIESPDRDAEATPPVETAPESAPEATPEPATAEPAASETVTLHVHIAEEGEDKVDLLYTTPASVKLMEHLGNLEKFSSGVQRILNAVINQENKDGKSMPHGVQRWLLKTYSLSLLVEETAVEGQAILTGQAMCSSDGDIIR